MEQLALKLILIGVMFVLSVLCGVLPLKLLQFLRKRAASALDVDEEKRWPSLLLCLVTCFSGGVFLATCFLHLLPEVTEKMQEIIQEYQWPASYPLAELISCSGFFLVFLIEELVILCLRGHHHHHHGGSSHRHHSGSFVHVHVVQTPGSPPGKSGTTPTTKNPIKQDGIQKSPPSFPTGSDDEDERAEMKALTKANNGPSSPISKVVGRENGSNIVSTGVNAELRSPPCPILAPCGDLSPTKQSISPQQVIANGYGHKPNIPLRALPHKFQNGHDREHCRDNHGPEYPSPSPCHDSDVFTFIDGDVSPFIVKKRQKNGTLAIDSSPTWMRSRHSSCGSDEDGNCPGIELPLNAEPECCEGPCDGRKEDPPIMMAYRPHAHSHGVRSITLVVALSFHSLIEGLAFGIQDTKTKTWSIFLGIIIHKCIIIFSTGVQLARTHAHQLILVVVTIVLVSLMSPIGAGVGVAVEQTWGHSETRDVTIMFFSGLSVGTFLYVTFFEVLIHERDNEHNNLLKLFAILVGFILMAALRTMEGKHSHGDEDHHHHDNVTASISFLETSTAPS